MFDVKKDILLESVYNKYNSVGNKYFSFNKQREKMSINSGCLNYFVDYVNECFSGVGLDLNVISDIAVIGSIITPLSDDNSFVDIVVILDKVKFYNFIRSNLYSNEFIDFIISNNDSLKNFDFNETFNDAQYNLILRSVSKSICDKKEKNVNLFLTVDSLFLNDYNYYMVVKSGNVFNRYVENVVVDYVDFLNDVNDKQFYNLVINVLYKSFEDYKFLIKCILNKKDNFDELSESTKFYESYNRLVKFKNDLHVNRFNNNLNVLWLDKDDNNLIVGYNNVNLDYKKTYCYMNILYSTINKNLFSNFEYSFNSFLSIVNAVVFNNKHTKSLKLKDACSVSNSYFGDFVPGSFLTEKVKDSIFF